MMTRVSYGTTYAKVQTAKKEESIVNCRKKELCTLDRDQPDVVSKPQSHYKNNNTNYEAAWRELCQKPILLNISTGNTHFQGPNLDPERSILQTQVTRSKYSPHYLDYAATPVQRARANVNILCT